MFVVSMVCLLLALFVFVVFRKRKASNFPKVGKKASKNIDYDYKTVHTHILHTRWTTSFGTENDYVAQVHNGKYWEDLKHFGGAVLTKKRARELYPNDPLELGIEKAKIDFFMRQLERQQATVLEYRIEHPTKNKDEV